MILLSSRIRGPQQQAGSCILTSCSGVGVTMLIFSAPLFSEFFSIAKAHVSCWISLLIFCRCHRSSAVVAPVKYKRDSNNSRCTFARSKILLTEKSTNAALVTPTPEPYTQHTPSITHYVRTCVQEAGIKGRDNSLHPTDTMECYYLSLSLKPASGKQVLNSTKFVFTNSLHGSIPR